MTSSEYDPELYKEIWGEYPPEQPVPALSADAEPTSISIESIDEEIVGQVRLVREMVLAGLDPRLDALELRLSAIESRLEGIERELKELVNRGVGGGAEIDGGGHGGFDAAQ